MMGEQANKMARYDFGGKVVLVTGASRGIGRAVAHGFGRCGARVIVNYAGNEAAAEESVALIEQAGGDAVKQRFDVADPEAVKQAVKEIVAREGQLDVLVNNAGVSHDGLAARIKDEDWDRTLAVNLSGAMYLCRAALRPMMKQKCGAIINMSSVVAQTGNPGQASYTAAKGGLIALSRSLAREVASRGIRVNVVAPGYIDTDMTSGLSDAVKEQMVASIPLGRVGSPAEVSNAVLWLAAPDSGYVTGQVINVNGGMHM